MGFRSVRHRENASTPRPGAGWGRMATTTLPPRCSGSVPPAVQPEGPRKSGRAGAWSRA